MNKDYTNRLIIILMGSILLLLIVNTVLFIKMNQLQSEIKRIFSGFGQVETLNIGDKAPDFNLVDTQGRQISLSQFSGYKTLLVFSDVSCPHCQQFWPKLNQFHNSHKGLNIIMISNGSPEENTIMMQEQSFDFPIVLWDEAVVANYKVPGTPYLLLLSADQSIDLIGNGGDLDKIEKAISD